MATQGLPPKVELHIHLDGSARHSTIWELSKAKGLSLPGSGTLNDLTNALVVHQPKDLAHFLRGYAYIIPPFVGDLSAVRRLALEFCADAAAQNIAYSEPRFCPHAFVDAAAGVTAWHVVDAVVQAMREGQDKYGIKVGVILCCLRGRPEWSLEVVRLCEQFRGEGVVGIDIAGDEKAAVQKLGEAVFDPLEKLAFVEARRLLVSRTAHAGEDGPAHCVLKALTELDVSRVGHGYHALDDASVLRECLSRRLHFETCPTSSLLTASVRLSDVDAGRSHPVVRLAHAGADFSINRDGPNIVMTSLQEEYDTVAKWGLGQAHVAQANVNAALASFQADADRQRLAKEIRAAYGGRAESEEL